MSQKSWRACFKQDFFILLVVQLVLRTDAISKNPYFIYKRLIIQIWGFKLWLSSKGCIMGTNLNILKTSQNPRKQLTSLFYNCLAIYDYFLLLLLQCDRQDFCCIIANTGQVHDRSGPRLQTMTACYFENGSHSTADTSLHGWGSLMARTQGHAFSNSFWTLAAASFFERHGRSDADAGYACCCILLNMADFLI